MGRTTTQPRKSATSAEEGTPRQQAETEPSSPMATGNTDSSEHTSRNPDTIAVRAYQFFLERGEVHGNDMDDWLRAERELGEHEAEALTRELNAKPAN